MATPPTSDRYVSYSSALLIGIGGCPSSGKSTVSILLAEMLHRASGLTVPIICQDDYFLPPDQCPAIRFKAARRDKQLLKHCGPGASGLIDAHDRDCLCCCRWESLTGLVSSVRSSYIQPLDAPRDEALRRAALCRSHRDLVEMGVRRLQAALLGSPREGHRTKPRPVVVEGSLLLAKIAAEDETPADMLPPEARTAQAELARCLAVKLFLHADEEMARKRRFGQSEFRDASKGGLRKPHEHWKFEGYWRDVAWPNYLRYHEYILKNRCGFVDGIHVQPEDVSLVDTVLWAVDRVAMAIEALE